MSNEPQSEPRLETLDYASSQIGRDPRKTVIVATFADQVEASLARQALERRGIRSFSTGDALLGGVGIYIGAMQRLDIFVAEADREEATEILKSIREARAARLRDPSPPACPQCGAPEVRKRLGRGSIAMIVLAAGALLTLILQSPVAVLVALLPALYLIFTWSIERWTCVKCGKKFSGKSIGPEERDDSEPEDELPNDEPPDDEFPDNELPEDKLDDRDKDSTDVSPDNR